MNMLAFSRAKYQAIKQRFAAEHPGLDEQTLADTVEGLTDLHDIVAAIVRAAITDEALAQGLRVLADQYVVGAICNVAQIGSTPHRSPPDSRVRWASMNATTSSDDRRARSRRKPMRP